MFINTIIIFILAQLGVSVQVMTGIIIASTL